MNERNRIVSGVLVVMTLAIALLLSPTNAAAQLFSGSITGVVADPNDAVIPGALVSLVNTETGDQRSGSTGAEGRYTFSSLQPGLYELSVESVGFKKFVRPEIRLSGSQAAEVNATLELGEVTETIEVSAQAIVLDTQTSNQTTTLNEAEITDLPISFRNPLALVHTQAGVKTIFANKDFRNRVRDQNFGLFSMNGGREASTTIMVDGLNNRGADWGSNFATPSVDAVQEMQISRNTYDAEYGRTGFGVVSMVTKGGSSDFHGVGYWFLRNDNLDANSWENNRAGRTQPEEKRNQVGGTISGPAWKKKRVYFMFGFEAMRRPGSSSRTDTLPTPLERDGDFSQSFNPNGSLAQIFDPFTTRPSPSGSGFIRDPLPGNVVPKSRIDPIAANVISKLYPLPNVPGVPGTQVQNFFGVAPIAENVDRYDLRGDWAANEKYRVFYRATRVLQNGKRPRFYQTGGETQDDNEWPYYQMTLSQTFTPTATWVINLLGGAAGTIRRSTPITAVDGFQTAEMGWSDNFISNLQTDQGSGRFSPAGYSIVGSARAFDNVRRSHSWAVNATHQRGSHTIKFGSVGEYHYNSLLNVYTYTLNFSRGMTSGPVAATNSSTTGNSIASMLLGTGSGGNVPNPVAPVTLDKYYAFYGQDRWHVNRRLTLTLGLRYEIQLPRTTRYNRQNWFDFGIRNPISDDVGMDLTGGLVFASPSERGQTELDHWNMAPRFGFAYKVTDRLVMRGGYGISYMRSNGKGGVTGNQGYSVTSQWVPSVGGDGINPLNLLSNPFPNGFDEPTGASLGALTQIGTNVVAFNHNNPSPYLQSYSLDFQYELTQGSVFEIGYTGNVGRKLNYGHNPNWNQMHPSFLSLGESLNEQVANPFFGVITSGALRGEAVPRHRLLRAHPQFINVSAPRDEKGASSSFNALYLKFTQRFSRGLTILASYQWSKALDNASEDQGWFVGDVPRNVFDFGSEWSLSAHDVPHDVATSFIWEVPVGKGRAHGGGMNSILDAIVGGWQTSGTLRYSSGIPINLRATNTLGVYGFGIQRPNITSFEELGSIERTPEQWFNRAAVSSPGKFEIGSAARYLPVARNHGPLGLDVALIKNFNMYEKVRTQFRAEFFNVTNTPRFGLHWANNQTVVGSGQFGRVTATRNQGPRLIQLGLKIQF